MLWCGFVEASGHYLCGALFKAWSRSKVEQMCQPPDLTDTYQRLQQAGGI